MELHHLSNIDFARHISSCDEAFSICMTALTKCRADAQVPPAIWVLRMRAVHTKRKDQIQNWLEELRQCPRQIIIAK